MTSCLYLASIGFPFGFLIVLSHLLLGTETVSAWGAIGEFGLAVVIAAVSFFGLVWWFKQNATNQRKDLESMATQLRTLEAYQRDQMGSIATRSIESCVRSTEATEANTAQLARMTDVMVKLQHALTFRPCFAIDHLPDKARREVQRLLTESRADKEMPRGQ